MLAVGFETAIPAIKRLQAKTLDSMATGIVSYILPKFKYFVDKINFITIRQIPVSITLNLSFTQSADYI